jgi:uroporphyrinogen-III decarboxylase
VGAPFTLVAYSVEGSANRHCIATKKMMTQAPEVLHAALVHYAEAIGQYACYQIECGAQSVQFFESWAHHLGAGQFAEFARPCAPPVATSTRAAHARWHTTRVCRGHAFSSSVAYVCSSAAAWRAAVAAWRAAVAAGCSAASRAEV